MKFKQVVPILNSSSVVRSLAYYIDVLGFDHKWEWGFPTSFGGVSKESVQIFFCENGQGNPGTWLSVFVDNIDEYYEMVNAKGAKIISAPETMVWGVREMLVEDPDGHRIRFGQNTSFRKKTVLDLESFKIVERSPTPQEFERLVYSVGWTPPGNEEKLKKIIAAALYAVVAEDAVSGDAIGCTILLGDEISFYYVKDMMVRRDWQSKGVGAALMQAVTNWLDKNGTDNALVGLYTGENLAPFYQQFGFNPFFGMARRIKRKKKE